MGVDIETSLRSFIEDVASSKPTPGGGSVAAVTGAFAAGLTSMVCRLTIGKKRYEEVQEEMEQLLKDSERLRDRLQALAVEDAQAYDTVIEALRMDRSTPEAKEERGRALQQALRDAAEVPMETSERSLDLLRVAQQVAAKGNVNALSDAGVAAHLVLAAFHGARLNVEINLSSIKSADYVAKRRSRLEAMSHEIENLHARSLTVIDERL
ncbi:MAG: cyclodeaminase/cyclohydrolase family protein [Thermoplasmata archaeon]